MWAPQLTSFAEEHRVTAPDLPGFGQTPLECATISEAAHLPNLERPEEFGRIVLGFLRQHGV